MYSLFSNFVFAYMKKSSKQSVHILSCHLVRNYIFFMNTLFKIFIQYCNYVLSTNYAVKLENN